MKLTDRIYLCGSGAYGISPDGDCHCYVLDAVDELVLIDCGLATDPAVIISNIEKDGLDPAKLTWLLLTHTHPDHANACRWFKNHHLQVKIAASAFEAKALQNGVLETLGMDTSDTNFSSFFNMNRVAADHILQDGETLQVGDLEIKAILTPGHTIGSMCFETVIDSRKMLFSGDEVFYKGFISLLAAPLSDYEHYQAGIEKLSGRDICGLFPAHLMWTLRNGQKHIDTALENFIVRQRPELKPFS